MRFVGIDPGVSGGLAFFENGKLVLCEPMPVIEGPGGTELDMTRIAEFLAATHGRADQIFIEKSQAIFTKGGSSSIAAFNYGCGYGLLRGLCHGLGLPYYLIHPQKWQRELLGKFAKGESKGAAAIRAQQLFPRFMFRASERCKKNHEGMVDAALIGIYGQRAFFPKEVPV